MPDIFLSYSRDDLTTARRFAEAFEREGFSVWWDQTLNPGEAFDEVTEKALQEARAVVVLWSKKSVASRWVRAEATQANDSKTLVPVMIEPCKRPIMFELTHTADLSNWKGNTDDPGWHSYLAGVKRVAGKKGAGAPQTVATAQGAKPPRQFGMRTLIGMVAVLVVGMGVVWLASRAPKTTLPQASAISGPVTKEVTLAVLPFANVSTDPEQEPFCDGLTEEFLNQLGQVKGLTVTGRMSSFSFKGKNVDPRSIAETLGVAYLLVGSIRKEGEKLKIGAQLINGKDGTQLWNKAYNRERKDLLALQEEVAKDVSQALQVKLSVGDAALVPGGTRNVDAFEAMVAANALSNEYTAEGARRAIDQYRRAIAIDPKFAGAWARLSSLYRTSARAFLTEEPSQIWIDRSNAALDEAVRLAPDAFYVQLLLGDRSVDRSEWSEADSHYKMAAAAFKQQVASNGSDDGSWIGAEFQLFVGRFKRYIEIMEPFRAEDPLNPGISMFLGAAYADAGNSPAAFAEYERGERLQGAQDFIRGGGASTALAIKDRQQINRWMKSYISLGPPIVREDDILVAMKPLLDKPAQALALLRQRARTPLNETELGVVASWMAYFGDTNGALDVLRTEAMRKAPAGILPMTFWNPVMREVRKMPGFKQLVRDIGMVDYWREFGWPDLCSPVGKDDFECH